MSKSYIPLEEAAAQLGLSVEQLVELQSQGSIRGFRDGATWKFDQAEVNRVLADRQAGLSADGSSINVFGGGVGMPSDDENASTDSGSALGILQDELGSSSGSSLEMLGSLGESDDNLLSGLPMDSTASALNPDAGIDASSGSRSELVSDLSAGDDDLVLNIESGSSASLLNFDKSGEDVLADISSQSDVISFGETRTAGDESPAGSGLDSEPIEIGGSDPAVELSSGSASDLDILDISDSGDGDLASAGSQDDVDLSLDLSLSGDDIPSDNIDVDLSAADNALSDSLDIDLSSSEPSSGGSALGLDEDNPIDLGSDVSPSQSDVSLSSVGSALHASVTPESDIQLNSPANSDLEELDELDDLISDVGGSDLVNDSAPATPVSSGGSDLLLDDDDDNLLLGVDDDDVLDQVGSDISVVGGSGINLMSPSDSGLSLESEPLDLAGSSISSIDISNEVLSDGSGSQPGSRGGSSGSLVDFKADEEFQLSPSGIGLEADDDSASQVIEVEDSSAFGVMDDELGAGDNFGQDDLGEAVDIGDDPIDADEVDAHHLDGGEIDVTKQTAAVVPTSYEVPFSFLNVLSLAGILVMLSACGLISADLMRNIWTDGSGSASVSSMTSTLLKALGMDG